MADETANADVHSLADLQDRTFAFACRIVKLCDMLGQSGGSSRSLSSELLRSGTSIGATLAQSQAFGRGGASPSVLEAARKEARETHYWLRLVVASDFVAPSSVNALLDEVNQLIGIFTATEENKDGG